MWSSKTSKVASAVVGVATLVVFVAIRRRRRRNREATASSTAAKTSTPKVESVSPSQSVSLATQQQLDLPLRIRPDKLPAQVGGWAVGEASWLYDRCVVVPLLTPIRAQRDHRLTKETMLDSAALRVILLPEDNVEGNEEGSAEAVYCAARGLELIPLSEGEAKPFSYVVRELFDKSDASFTLGGTFPMPSSNKTVQTFCMLTFYGANMPSLWKELAADPTLRLEELLAAVHVVDEKKKEENEETQEAEEEGGVLELTIRDINSHHNVHTFPIPCNRAAVLYPLQNHTNELLLAKNDVTMAVSLDQAPSQWAVNILSNKTNKNSHASAATVVHRHFTPVASNKEVSLQYRRPSFGLTFGVRLNVLVTDAPFSIHPMVLLQDETILSNDKKEKNHHPCSIVASVTQINEPFPEGWALPPPKASSGLTSEMFEDNVSRLLVRPQTAASSSTRSPIESWTVSGQRASTFLESIGDLTCRTIVVPHPSYQKHFWIIRWQAPTSQWEDALPELHEFLAGCQIV